LTQYTMLAQYYDALTEDVPYDAMTERLMSILDKGALRPRLVLELGCGTGSISRRLSEKGLELIAVDSSPDMLGLARDKCVGLAVPPVLVCQDMADLDLYGTVQAVVSTLDSVNYLPDITALERAFAKASLFLESRGLFVFDVKTPALFARMAGTASVQEGQDFLCAWQYGYQEAGGKASHVIDLFVKSGGNYRRHTETHHQRAFTRLQIESALRKARLRPVEVYQDYSARPATDEKGRLLFVAEKY